MNTARRRCCPRPFTARVALVPQALASQATQVKQAAHAVLVVLVVLAALAVLSLAGCAGFGPPTGVSLSQAELQRLVERSFPIDRRLLDVVDVSLTTPRIQLLPQRNRLAIAVDVQGRDRLLGGSWAGVLAFDTQLRWDNSDRSVRMSQVRVQGFSLRTAGTGANTSSNGSIRSTAERVARALAERALEDLRLYQLSPERAAELQRRGVMPGDVTVTPRGVDITLVPLVP